MYEATFVTTQNSTHLLVVLSKTIRFLFFVEFACHVNLKKEKLRASQEEQAQAGTLRWIAGLGQGRTARRCWPVHGSRGKRIHCTVAACGELPLAVSGLSTHNGSGSEKIGTSLTPSSSQALSLLRAHIHAMYGIISLNVALYNTHSSKLSRENIDDSRENSVPLLMKR